MSSATSLRKLPVAERNRKMAATLRANALAELCHSSIKSCACGDNRCKRSASIKVHLGFTSEDATNDGREYQDRDRRVKEGRCTRLVKGDARKDIGHLIEDGEPAKAEDLGAL